MKKQTQPKSHTKNDMSRFEKEILKNIQNHSFGAITWPKVLGPIEKREGFKWSRNTQYNYPKLVNAFQAKKELLKGIYEPSKEEKRRQKQRDLKSERMALATRNVVLLRLLKQYSGKSIQEIETLIQLETER